MAYDPKVYLQQALKQGFQSRYEPTGASPETGQAAEQYAGEEARFGDVSVVPLSELVYEGTGDAAYPVGSTNTGYMVSSPLMGQYQGYFRNDIYDNEGNFLRTTISEPDTDKYGLKDLARLGLTAASFGGLGPVAQGLSKAASGIAALKSGDPLRILSAASNIPGAGGFVPPELKTLMDYAGKAGQVQSALKGDPNAIFGLITGAAKSGTLPKGLTGDVDLSGADAIPDFFTTGEGFDTSQIPDYLGKQTDTGQPTYLSDKDYSDELYRLEGLHPATEDALNLENFLPGTGLSTQTDQSFDIIGKREKDIPDWDILPDVVTTPRSIRDVGPVTQIQPGEKLEGTDITELDLAKDLPKVVGGTKTTTKRPSTPSTGTQSFTTPRTPGQPTVYNPVFANVPEFDPGSMFQLADRTGMSLNDLLKILRG